jgi:hypothetical protein
LALPGGGADLLGGFYQCVEGHVRLEELWLFIKWGEDLFFDRSVFLWKWPLVDVDLVFDLLCEAGIRLGILSLYISENLMRHVLALFIKVYAFSGGDGLIVECVVNILHLFFLYL